MSRLTKDLSPGTYVVNPDTSPPLLTPPSQQLASRDGERDACPSAGTKRGSGCRTASSSSSLRSPAGRRRYSGEQEFEQFETAHTGAAVSARADAVSEDGRACRATRMKSVISLERRVASEAR